MDETQKDRLSIMVSASKQFEDTITILFVDLQKCADTFNVERSQFWRRVLVRSLFAYIEGATHCMKRVAHACQFQPGVEFSDKERGILSEFAFELYNKASSGKTKMPLKESIKFSFNVYARVHLAKYELNANKGWQALIKSISIRDRLTHPKRVDDLIVSDDEMQVLFEAYTWFDKSIREVQEISLKAMTESFES
jgi:hypothetical protein